MFPKIEVEAKVEGKRSRKKLDSTLNTSVFANFVNDQLQASDDKKVSVKIVEEKE